jgi:hypothetical protein
MKIVIKNKETKIVLEKDQIVEVLETADGVAFNLRNGLSLTHVDNFMPSTAKQLIKATIDQCAAKDATITVDLENHVTPASIMVNFVAPPSEKVT